MASYNKVILIGNLVADPELKQTPSGVAVTSFRIAINRKRNKPGEQSQADYIDIICWRERAEFVTKYFSKGKSILIEGEIHSRTWIDNNNVRHQVVEVVADDVRFVEKKQFDSSSGSNYSNNQNSYESSQFSGSGYEVPSSSGTGDGASFGDSASSFEELTTDDELPF